MFSYSPLRIQNCRFTFPWTARINEFHGCAEENCTVCTSITFAFSCSDRRHTIRICVLVSPSYQICWFSDRHEGTRVSTSALPVPVDHDVSNARTGTYFPYRRPRLRGMHDNERHARLLHCNFWTPTRTNAHFSSKACSTLLQTSRVGRRSLTATQ